MVKGSALLLGRVSIVTSLTLDVDKPKRWKLHVSVLVLLMFLIFLMSQVCDQTNCESRNYHLIILGYDFEVNKYLNSVEDILQTLFPKEGKPRSDSDVQMTFLGSINIVNKTAFDRGKRSLAGDPQPKRMQRKRQRSAVESQVQKPELIEALDKDVQIVKPLSDKEHREHTDRLQIEVQMGKIRDLLSKDDKEESNLQKENEISLQRKNSALEDFRLRAQRLAKVCPVIAKQAESSIARTLKIPEVFMSRAESVKGVFWHEESQTAYCYVPKAGCTFWIRVFSFLQNFTSQPAQTPWDIPRRTLHTRSQNPYARGAPLWYLRDMVMAPDSLRFIVARDPFTRLWSAFVDKFVLPDFWHSVGVNIISQLRTSSTALARRCGHDVTFSEFIQFALTSPDSHWEPIYKRCDPCRFKPQIIADMSTFGRDSSFVLDRMGMKEVISRLNRTQQKEIELRTLIEYNYEIINSSRHLRGCVTLTGLARLLWKAFQMNGYIPIQYMYSPPGPGESFSVEDFTRHVVEVSRYSSSIELQLKAQRKHFMRDAYRFLSPELLQGLKDVYRLDFELFGYDDSPFTV